MKKNYLKYILISICLLLVSFLAEASIQGPNKVLPGSTESYSCSSCHLYLGSGYWFVLGGTVVGSNSNYNSVSVQWDSNAGSGSISWRVGRTNHVTLNVARGYAPSAPNTPQINEYLCDQVNIGFSGSPSSGETWYWQSSSNGTSVSNSSSTRIVSPSTGTNYYYLRAKNDFGWSSAAILNLSWPDHEVPPAPSTTSRSRCEPGSVTLSSTSSSDLWYTSATSGTPFHTGSSYTTSFSSTKTYYVQAKSAFNCYSASRTPVTATIYSQVQGGSISTSQNICGGETPSQFTGSEAVHGNGVYQYQWRMRSPGGSWSNISGATNKNYQASSLSSSKDFQRRVISCGKTAYSNVVSVVVNTVPSLPSANSVSRCGSGTLSLSASVGSNGNTIRWYTALKGGSHFRQSTSYSPSLSSSKTYYISSYNTNTGCESSRVSISATVNSIPATPTASSASRCGAGAVSLSGSIGSNGNTIRWYTSSSGGSHFRQSTSYSPSLSSSKTYYISSYNTSTGCESSRVSISATVNSIPSTPTASSSSRCGAGTVSLSGTIGSNGNTIRWYTSSSGGSHFRQSTSYSPSLSSSKTYYISSYNTSTGCESSRVSISATVNPIPALPTAYSDARCGAGTLSLAGAIGSNGNTIRWYTSSSGGSHFRQSTSYNPSLSSSKTYYISSYNTNTGCESARVSVGAIVRTIPNAPSPNSDSRCGSGIVSLSGTAGSGGNTVRWYNDMSGGVHFRQSLSYSPSLSANQTFYISTFNTSTGCESDRVAVDAYVNSIPSVDAGANLSFHKFENSVSLNSTGESPAGGTYSGAYVNNNSFDISQSGVGDFTVTYTYTNSDGCSASTTKTLSVLANPEMTVEGTLDIVWGEDRELTVDPGFSGYQWYKDAEAINGATSNSYTVESIGEYHVEITAASGATLNLDPINFINLASQQNENFVQTIIYKTPKKEGESVKEIGEVNEQISYFDGLGRPTQTVATQASPNKNDLISPVEYDELGRPNKRFLPYAADKKDGLIHPTALRGAGNDYLQSSQYAFYAGSGTNEIANTTAPFAETVYENSPLNRPVAQYAPGENWAKEEGAKAVATEYQISSESDSVMRFNVDGNSLLVDGEYGSGVFQKTIVIDENGNQSITFTDASNKTVLKRNVASGMNFDTYYAYDVYDNLRFVIPPEAIHQLDISTGQFPSDLLDQFVFQYQYDNRDRMEWKKVPGAEPVVMIYDDRDRLVLTQDGEQAKDNLFSFTKYDALNRTIMTGETEINNSIPNLRDLLNGSDWLQNYDAFETLGGSKYGYTSNSLPKNLDLVEIHTVTYYDNYDFRSEISLEGAEYDYGGHGMENAFEQSNHVKGQVTGSLTRVLGSNEMLASINYYDERYRLMQNISEQNGGNLITTNNGYDFAGNVLGTITEYHVNNENYFITESFTYDHLDRLMEVTHEVTEPVKWEGLVGYEMDANGDLTHTGAAGYTNTNAYSKTPIKFENNGSYSVEIETQGRFLIGLNDDPNSTSYSNMDYALYVAGNGWLYIYENGARKTGADFLNSYIIGDVVEIRKKNGQIHYVHNGEIFWTSSKAITTDLYADVTTYNVGDRILDAKISTSGKQLMVSNQYNELGELINRKLHEDGDNFAQSVDYRYNIRGWLTRINHADLSTDNANEKADLFGMELGYTDNFDLNAEAQYNGNIAAVKWGGKRNDIDAENVLQQNAYGYGYDGLNRITAADFYEGSAQTSGQKYQLRIDEYDQNGNIKQLKRRDADGVLMDDLTYDYAGSGNQLNFVSDIGDVETGFKDGNTSGLDYTYDDNGNMISDANKEIDSIKYNNLNLPEEVIFENGNKITYIYSASGTKLRQEVYENNTLIKATDYIGSLILENDTLQFIQTAEGRVVPKTVDGVDKNEYQYHLKDHLGNVRTTFAVRDDNYATDFETAGNPYFDNYDEITILSNPLKKSGNYAHRLSGGGTDVVGLMKTLYVSKGDKVSAEVYGKYLDAQFTNDEINGAALVNALVTMLGGGTLTGEGTIIENNLNSDFISAAMADGSEEESPKAYLNYIMLDKNFNYVNSGFERLAESAADPGDGSGTHQKLTFEEIAIEEDGYLMVFLSNESQQSVEVFWDDFRVDHHYNAVLQADDYYPFGLTFNSYTRSYSKANNYKFNGKEEQEETGWLDYGARMYMPDLGRWFNVDPLANKYDMHSPYHYALNNPVRYIDPDGMQIEGVTKKDAEKTHEDLNAIFAGEQFAAFRSLITRSGRKGNGKKFNAIDSDALSGAIEGLEGDDLALVNLVAGAINSEDVHKVEFVELGDDISSDGGDAVVEHLNNAQSGIGDASRNAEGNINSSVINVFGGAGFNVPTENGSHSIIVEGEGVQQSGGNRAVTTGHEVMGHGIPSARGADAKTNNTHAIRTDNLIRRVLGIQTRDGSNHAGGKVVDPNALPKIGN
ncbi:hypothetical protein MATR_18330 [Marivirga tractuosa]|uniref:YD repeat protein n=1 Tax=Marivirga tractuosa (strain ATCC 23168 / DSM 4126 / NBRC 15989 / NCIMB 1408 / VKM B-1430 / H-43) TaxID=643867 RepID=E4TPY7_MARTH|nr:DUF6443 domain-containing protein [Marivirga tractuosa]ADR20544.1 hypothetical protein Ftrac_0540 [Marivirga tractuosa DSM 4126]BDD15008.1 hypothetical protein MATR_18330 [Marivirga tractuosa]